MSDDTDQITVLSTSGEHIATFTGDEATAIIELAVNYLFKNALHELLSSD